MRISVTKISTIRACSMDSPKIPPRRVLLRPQRRRPKKFGMVFLLLRLSSYRLRFLLLYLFEQALKQIPLHLKYLDPAAYILDTHLHLLRPCATVSQRQMPHVLQAHSLLTGGCRVEGHWLCCSSVSLRTTRTGQWAWRTTESLTLPMRARLIPPRPRLPITISPASSSSAKATISSSGLPIPRWVCSTLLPAASISSTWESSNNCASRSRCSCSLCSQCSSTSGPTRWPG